MATPTTKPMSYAWRAAISSACIFPGAGLFLLRHYVRGCVFAVPALIIILMLFKNLITVSMAMSARLDQEAREGNLSLDFIGMFHELHGALFASPYWQDGKWILLASWLLSIMSSYFVGKKFDLQQTTEAK
ncbi:MAG TPA: hypothetical protein VL995_12165 [Cellvibrio sp.]|nr:hypothetical protein [Cellvibrio sp.]